MRCAYNEVNTKAAAPARPTMRRLLCSEPAPFPRELPVVDGVALACDENGNVKLDVALADVQLADVDICTVVVAFASTSVFVIVLVQVSVVVTLLASTEAGARQATSAAAAVVRRIVEETW